MALPNYDRLLYIGDSDTIAGSLANRNELATYLTTNGFNGVYLADAPFGTNNADINSLITTINSNLVAAVGPTSASAAKVVTYNSTYNNVDFFLMYNDFWNSGDRFSPDWIDEYQGINGISSSFWVTDYQTTQSQDIRLDGYTEVEAATAQISASNYGTEFGSLVSVFEQGVPRYFTAANNKKSTNVFNKLDILAESVRKLYFNTPESQGVSLITDPYFSNPANWVYNGYDDAPNLWYVGFTAGFTPGKFSITTTSGPQRHKILIYENPSIVTYPGFNGPCYVTAQFKTGRWDNTNANTYVSLNIDNGYEESQNPRYPDTTKVIGDIGKPIQPYTTYRVTQYLPNGILGGAADIATLPSSSGHTWAIHLYNSQIGDVNEITSYSSVATKYPPALKLPIHFYIDASQIDFGGNEDYSGYSIQAARSFDEFERKLLNTIVNRMTKFQKDYLDVKGFAYYKYPFAQAALNAPNCISSLTTVSSSTTAFISWVDGTGGAPTSYDVYVSTNSNPSGSVAPTNVTSNSITVTGLTPSTLYYVAVISKNSIGNSSGCTTYSFTTTAAPPPPPTATNYRILLIEDTVIGNAVKENDRISYAKTIGANFIQMYGGWQYGGNRLATFISKSKAAGIQKVGAIVNGRYQAEKCITYNDSRANSYERWDDINIESEFWAGGGDKIKCRIQVFPGNIGDTYNIRINGVDHEITAASASSEVTANQLYNKLVADFGGTSFYNTMSFNIAKLSYSNSYIEIVGSGLVTYNPTPAPVTGPTNVFTSGSLVSVSSSYNPDKIYCPTYIEVGYNGTIVSGDRSPNRTTDDVNYSQTNIAIEDRPTGMPTLTWLALAKFLDSASAARSNQWTVSAYVQNYGNPGTRWGVTESKYMVQHLDTYEATNYVTSISAGSILGQVNALADAVRLYGGGFSKTSQSFVPLWSAESAYNGTYLRTYSSSFYPNMSGGLDQAELNWSSSYLSVVSAASRSYLDLKGTAYFYYPQMQINYKYP